MVHRLFILSGELDRRGVSFSNVSLVRLPLLPACSRRQSHAPTFILRALVIYLSLSTARGHRMESPPGYRICLSPYR